MAAQLHYIIYLAKLLLSFWRLTKNSGNGSVNNKENNNNEVLSNVHICRSIALLLVTTHWP